MILQQATTADAPAIRALIASVSHHCTIDPSGKGAERFFATVAPTAIAGYIADPRYCYLVAIDGDALAGVAALRDGRHVYHLFIAPAFQRRGLSRMLWLAMRDRAEPGTPSFTVNSSLYAVSVYERFGFVATGPKVEMDGVAFVPMQLAANAPAD